MDNTTSFARAIDTHNVANGDPSWLENKINATGELLSDIGEGLTTGLVSSVVAGVNSIANSFKSLGNTFLGMDNKETPTLELLKDLDSNLADYYTKHSEGVEIAGFALGMFAPGTAGIKALNMAKSGIMGTNMAKASGLMTTLTWDYAKAAKAEAALTNSPFSILNKSTLQGLAQGFGSSILEMAAFETAVAVTMFKSPVLDEKSVGDLIKDDIYNSVLFGSIGGVFKGFQLYGQVTKAGKASEILSFPYRNVAKADESADPLTKVFQALDNKFKLPEAMGPLPNMEGIAGITERQGIELITKERQLTLDKLDQEIRLHLNDWAKDPALGNQLADALKESKDFQQAWNALGRATEVRRISLNESVAYGDTHFLRTGVDKLTKDQWELIAKTGKWDELITPSGGQGAQGYKVVGDMSELRVTSVAKDKAGMMFDKDTAFAEGYDIVRNLNGSFSINPNSKIIQPTNLRRTGNDKILDFKTGEMLDKALPGLADLATKEAPVVLRGDTVLYGKNNPIKVGKSESYDPTKGTYLEAQARAIWAKNTEIKWDGLVIGEKDLPLLERLYEQGENLPVGATIHIKGEKGLSAAPRGQALQNYILQQKEKLAKEMDGVPLEEVSLRLNTPEEFLAEGKGSSILLKKGDDFTTPRYAKITYAPEDPKMLFMDPNNHTGALEFQYQKKLINDRVMQNWSNFAGKDFAESFPDAPNWLDPGRTPTREGAGAGLASFANANFGSAGGWAQQVAQQVDKLLLKRKTETAKSLNLSIGALRSGEYGAEAMAEAAIINNKLLQSEKGWKFHPDGTNTLITREDYARLTQVDREGKLVNPGYVPEELIQIENNSVADLFKNHIEIAGGRQAHVSNLKGAAGIADDFDKSVLYPVPVDTTKLKYFAVVNPLAPVSLADKARVIAAKDATSLQKLVEQVDTNIYKVRTKEEIIAEHKSLADYEYSLGMNESMVDSGLKREGKLSQHFPTINEGFLERMMDWHMRQEEVLTHSMVYHRYSPAFEELKALGARHTNLETSQFRSLTEKLEQSAKNPYTDIVKTALNISRSSEYQPWINFNNFVKDAIEGPINKLRDTFNNMKEPDQAFVDRVNEITRNMGQGQTLRAAADIMLANNNIAPRPWLQGFVGKLNSILSTTLLQWDTFNAVNNVVSTSIISAPEMQKLLRGIANGDAAIAGKLKDLTSVVMPDGSGITLPTTSKLLMNAHNAFIKGDKALIERFEKSGAINDLSREMRQMLDNVTLNFEIATEKEAKTALDKAVEFGRKWTGNEKAEQYTRYLSAHMAMEVADLGVAAKLISSKEADELITLFTNRTQGNYLYSQRPIIFQGVVGQAIGLFQTYQFNLMQQVFKHVADGDGKATAMLMGLQGSIYGMQGLPAFNFLNTHIVGNAYGNTNHKDLYTASYTTFGKSLGDWLIYGAGSNALGLVDPSMRFNLYSRGDINPRQLTVLPSKIEDIPIVAASTKFIGNIFNAFGKIGAGGDIIPTISQAIEHNGLSRPLAGLAQIVQGYTTTNAGSLLSSSQDLYQIASLTRLGGAKPFDESLALDALYRINAYKANNTKKVGDLGEAIKTTLVAGGNPSADQINEFAASYVKKGGRIEGFNKYMANLQLQANRSQVNAIVENLQNPMAKNLQIAMGGVPVQDFMNTPPEKN